MSHAFKYLPQLDGLRAVSILLVLVAHGGLGDVVPGGLGVTVFFFISGFLITSLLLDERESTGGINLKNFYLRRFWRLTPAVVAHLAASVLALLWWNGEVKWIEPVSVLLYFSNYYKMFVHYVGLLGQHSPFDIYWSLAVEEHFYFLFTPLLYFTRTRRTVGLLLGAMMMLPLLVRLFAVHTLGAEPAFDYTYRASDARLDSMAYGCALAVLGRERVASYANRAMFGVGLALIVWSLLYRSEYFRNTFRYTVQGVALFFIVAPLVYGKGFERINGWLSTRPMVYIGRISYSMYLWHWLVIVLMFPFLGLVNLDPLWQLVYYALSFITSMASYHWVEQPFLAMRRRFGSNQ